MLKDLASNCDARRSAGSRGESMPGARGEPAAGVPCHRCRSNLDALPQAQAGRWRRVLAIARAGWPALSHPAVVDDSTRENLCLVADTSLSGSRVIRELEALVAKRGLPIQWVSDTGPEFTSLALLRWAQGVGLDWRYIDPGKPQQNAFIKSFNGRLRYASGEGRGITG